VSLAPVTELACWLGVDIGKIKDPAALLLLQRARTFTPGGFDPASGEAGAWKTRYAVLFLERLPLGTSYPAVVERLASVCDSLAAQESVTGPLIEVVIDVTGVGRPVLDMVLAKRLKTRGVVGVNYTGGQVAREAGDRIYNVPKRDLVAQPVLLFQSGELQISEKLPDAPVLVNELVNFQESLTAAGNATYGNDGKRAKNDDYVNTLALAAWRAVSKAPRPMDGTQRLW